MENQASEKQFDENGGEREQVIGEDAGCQHVRGGDGSYVEAAENSLLAKRYEHGAKTPEAAHYVEGDHRAEKEADHARIALGEDSGVEEKHADRKDDAEEEEHFIAQGELNAHARETHKVAQSRSLLPVISMKTSSREGVAISRLTSWLPSASRCLTRETMVCGGRWVCRTYVPSTSRASTTPSKLRSVPFAAGLASFTSMRVLPPERCLSSRGEPRAITLPWSTMATRSQRRSASSM